MPTFTKADILLPDFEKVSAERWSVIACDQFTSEEEYWKAVEETVADAPSTLRIILPEVYLGKNDEARIEGIHKSMDAYASSVLKEHPDSLILLRRTLPDGRTRTGLVGKIDLEDYDYHKDSTSPVRATEGTVLSRIPPRVRVRRGASLESPHVMLLIDDEKDTIMKTAYAAWDESTVAYATPLMQGGGYSEGRFLPKTVADELISRLHAFGDVSPLHYAVGDGNHSLATAKAYYEEVKKALGEEAKDHPARYALAEVVNIHDAGLDFKPIYRVVFGVDPEELLSFLSCAKGDEKTLQHFHYITKNNSGTLTMAATHTLSVGTLQKALDAYAEAHPTAEIDYIHGEDSLEALAKKDGAVGFLFDGMQKNELFPAVTKDGPLPRKTFSMGEAREKRYYMECRKIR